MSVADPQSELAFPQFHILKWVKWSDCADADISLILAPLYVYGSKSLICCKYEIFKCWPHPLLKS